MHRNEQNNDGEAVDRPEQAEWTETFEDPAEESAGPASREKNADPAPSDGEGTIAHRLNRVTRYASAAGNADSAEPAPTPDPAAQPVDGSPQPAAYDPAPAAAPPEPAPAPQDALAPAPPMAAAEPVPEHPAAPPAEARPVPADSMTSEHEPAVAESAAFAEAPLPDAPDPQAPLETPTEPTAEAPAAVAEPAPGPAHEEAAEPEPAAAQSSVEAPAAPSAPGADRTPPAPAANQAPPDPPPAAAQSPEPAAAGGEVLTVGRGIRLVAKLCECAELLVEGHLEATARARHLMVAQGGRFIGSAEVDTAEIHGHFEGNLTVAKRLLIPASGSVAGTTCYQEIVIEAGGRIMGNTQRLSEPAAPGDTAT